MATKIPMVQVKEVSCRGCERRGDLRGCEWFETFVFSTSTSTIYIVFGTFLLSFFNVIFKRQISFFEFGLELHFTRWNAWIYARRAVKALCTFFFRVFTTTTTIPFQPMSRCRVIRQTTTSQRQRSNVSEWEKIWKFHNYYFSRWLDGHLLLASVVDCRALATCPIQFHMIHMCNRDLSQTTLSRI